MKKKVCIIVFIIFFSISIFFSEKVYALKENYRDEAAKELLQQLEDDFENDNEQNSSSRVSIPPIEKTDENVSEVVEGTLEKIMYIVIVVISIIGNVLLF